MDYSNILSSFKVNDGETQLRIALNCGKIGFWQKDLRTDSILEVSDLCKVHFGAPDKSDFSNDDFHNAIHPDDLYSVWHCIQTTITNRTPYEIEFRTIWPDESVHWLRAHGTVSAGENGDDIRLVGITEDITDRKRAEEEQKQAVSALEESDRRLRLALESGGLGLWNLDLTTGKYIEVSQDCLDQFGLPSSPQLTESDFFALVHPDDLDAVQQALGETIARQQSNFHSEFRCIWPQDQSIHWISTYCTVSYDDDYRPIRLTGVTRDVSSRRAENDRREKALQEALEQADREPLSGLLNHRAFHEKLDRILTDRITDTTTIALVMLDLDSFKFFNDVYGHSAGDEVLRNVAARLKSIGKNGDLVARFGGDEFALLLHFPPNMPLGEIEVDLKDKLSEIFYRQQGFESAIPIVVSLGVAIVGTEETDRDSLLRKADDRLRQAKSGWTEETETQAIQANLLSGVEGFPMLNALVTAVDNKDRYTRKHSEDVLGDTAK